MKVIKKLIKLESGNKAEAIYYESPTKQVICFSTQLNCAVGCSFCALTGKGKTVNLSVNDMLLQVLFMDPLKTDKIMLFSIMGEGEPFLNYNNVIEIMKILQYRSNTKMSVSTSGYKIRKFAHEEFIVPVKLQVSVHSANTLKRSKLVPNATGLIHLIKGINYYHMYNEGDVDLNFTLIEGINDSKEDMLRIFYNFRNEHIKLSKLNGSVGNANADYCLKKLQDLGMSVEYQETDGADINATCSQISGIVCQKGE